MGKQMSEDQMRPSAERVHTVPLGLSEAHLIETDSGFVLVDAGSPYQEGFILRHLRALRQAQDKALGSDKLCLIFITHAHIDHYGSAAALRRLTGAPVAIHRADAEAMARGETRLGSARGRGKLMPFLLPLVELFFRPEAVQPDLVLEDGDCLDEYGLQARVMHTPGHTLGSSCLIIEEQMSSLKEAPAAVPAAKAVTAHRPGDGPQSRLLSGEPRIAFVGDLLTNNGHGRPSLQRLFAEDWSLLKQSYARLQEVELESVYCGHGRRPVSGQVLQQLIASESEIVGRNDIPTG
jgi:glyoxylase-like metal-dependent hydrolase (beta-lactamase superfamily II)